ncbi:hypothetical protein [Burkholderia lata]|uniref:hypothetical protein n=1 Tax=Burkholderia lata (strain ATCC 17760 / DSM 23089 / LMG 22485 / NCIMB 9086 / R18194 / 383) TaxID=482957 RepID=UPI00399B9F92
MQMTLCIHPPHIGFNLNIIVFRLETVFLGQHRDALNVGLVRRKRFRRNLFEPAPSACDRRLPFGTRFTSRISSLSSLRIVSNINCSRFPLLVSPDRGQATLLEESILCMFHRRLSIPRRREVGRIERPYVRFTCAR